MSDTPPLPAPAPDPIHPSRSPESLVSNHPTPLFRCLHTNLQSNALLTPSQLQRGAFLLPNPTPLVGAPHTPSSITTAAYLYTLLYYFPPPNAPSKLPLTDNSFPLVV